MMNYAFISYSSFLMCLELLTELFRLKPFQVARNVSLEIHKNASSDLELKVHTSESDEEKDISFVRLYDVNSRGD